MQPSISDTLRCVLDNLEGIVFPHLEEEHAQSVARCTSILLRVVLLRLAGESTMLAEDSAEKRTLFADLAEALADDPPGELAMIVAELTTASAETPLPVVTPDALTAENVKLKATLEGFIVALHAQRGKLGEARFLDLQSRVRRQLRAQIDRELAFVKEPYGGPGFPY